MSKRINGVPAVNPFRINPTVWDDLRVPVTSTRKGGSKDPDFAVWLKDTAGTSQGVFLEWFDKDTEEELYFSVQLPHNYKLGTPIHAHVHWVGKSAGGFGQGVSWGLEYTWIDIAGLFGVTTIIGSNVATGQVGASPAADTHYLTELGMITPGANQGANVSSMLTCRLFRDATSSIATDNYTADAGLLEIDFHYQIDTPGSFSEYSKY